jgi:hypothetical protein
MYVKYPHTPYLPWSQDHDHEDHLVLDPTSVWNVGTPVVVTEKMDGENTTMYRDYIHARSIDSGYHSSRTWVKGFHAQIRHLIPEDVRICGENLYAEHSIRYEDLPSYFLGFSAWRGDWCLSWDDTLELFNSIGIASVPVLSESEWPVNDFTIDTAKSEGYVIRVRRAFTMDEFANSIAKWVRADHVQTTEHWKYHKVKANGLSASRALR